MSDPGDLRRKLESLADLLLEPFGRSAAADNVLAHPITHELLRGGDNVAHEVLALLRQDPTPDLARAAVLMLSQSSSESVRRALLDILGSADEPLAVAFEPGIWRRPDGEEAVARDIFEVVTASDNPAPLILLQRPAAATVKARLKALVRARRPRFAEYAMAAFAYAVEPSDMPFLNEVASWVDRPALSAAAGIEMLRLDARTGWSGIEAGLIALDEDQRVATFTALQPFLPKDARQALRFDPRQPAGSRPEELKRLRDAVFDGK